MKAKGIITSIGDTQTFDSGAKKLSFQIDTKEQYNNILSFDLFKGAEHLEHLDNFLKFNKVGDSVEVEFNIQCKEYNGKYFTNLQMWKCEKLGYNQEQPTEQIADGDDDLPF